MIDDEKYMKMALDLAEKGRGDTSPNPMVGAVIVNGDKIVGKGYHRAAGTAHAEVHAINDAGKLAKHATLYVTLEPCNHTGRTPPCTEKILAANISRVVIAMKDPNPHVKGDGIGYLKANGVSVTSGVLQAEAEKTNEVFVKYIQTRQPFVILKCAATLDGRIATRTGDAKWISGEESRQYVHELRHAVDAIMVGIETVKSDNPRLTTRLKNRTGRDPTRIILDTRLCISEQAKMLQLDSKAETIVITGDLSAAPDLLMKKDRLEKQAVRVLQAPVKENRIDLKALMDLLGDMEITSLLIEGGGSVIASSFSTGIVDKIMFFYAPKILGGSDGVPICNGPGPDLMKDCIPVRDISIRRFGGDILVEGYLG
jgi:diaminohydroxyphosphoribosylaminopyrimidine deaminase/5-amino-6-(5-phosphoribosylamino)uracil reductase